MTSFFDGVGVPGGKPSTSSAHARGSASVDRAVELVPARWAISAAPTGPRQRIALCSTGRDDVAARRIEALDGVDRPEHLGHAGAGRVEVEADLLAVADQAVRRQGEPVAIDLEAVAQAGLDDPLRRGRSGRSGGGRRGPARRARRRRGRRRRHRAAARRSPAPGRRAARGCRARCAASGPAGGCATPRARPAASQAQLPEGFRRPSKSAETRPLSVRQKASGLHVLADEGAQGLGGADDVGGRRRRRRRSGRRARPPPRPPWPTSRPTRRTAAASAPAAAAARAARRGRPCRRGRGPGGPTT